jgi:hypothetical protein
VTHFAVVSDMPSNGMIVFVFASYEKLMRQLKLPTKLFRTQCLYQSPHLQYLTTHDYPLANVLASYSSVAPRALEVQCLVELLKSERMDIIPGEFTN